MGERWLPVVGHNGLYDVSDLGRVRSLWFRNKQCDRRRQHPRMLLLATRGGYHRACLSRGDGSERWVDVQRLVLEAFVGPCPEGQEAAHLNGVPGDDRLQNLKWATHAENMAHCLAHGTVARGASLPQTRLTPDRVRAMRLLRPSRSLSQLARSFGVSLSSVQGAVTRKTWAYVD